MKRTRTILTTMFGIIAALGLILTAGCARFTCGADATTGAVSSVQKITLVDQVEATGKLQSAQQALLAWKTSGTVAEVLVQPGDLVQAGDVLLRLDPASVPANVVSAQADLVQARQALDQLTEPDFNLIAAGEAQLAKAYSAWLQARASLDQSLEDTPASGDADLYDAWDEARADLDDTQDDLPLASASIDVQAAFQAARAAEKIGAQQDNAEAAAEADPENEALAQKAADLKAEQQAAQERRRALEAGLDSDAIDDINDLVEVLSAYDRSALDFITSLEGEGASADAVALQTAWAAYDQSSEALEEAVTGLYSLLREPDADDLAAAQARYQAAQASVDLLSIVAPFDGEILAVNHRPGDVVSAQSVAVSLADRARLQVVVKVDETEVGALKIGDPATVSLEAFPDLALTGSVVAIDPLGVEDQGLVKYTVKVEVAAPAQPVYLGATASLSLQTGQPREALAVPISAVQSDEQGEYVNRVTSSGGVERVNIVSGQIVDDLVAVEGSLNPGDSLALATSATDSSAMNRRAFMGQ